MDASNLDGPVIDFKKDIGPSIEMTFYVRGMWRWRLALILVRMAAWIGGFKVVIVQSECTHGPEQDLQCPHCSPNEDSCDVGSAVEHHPKG